ncbi:MAG: VWA domain-containing protein [Myxococcaceae bacterium]|nr:VWA domain-containing protein [Myxococcaceae bacterium]
MNKTVAYLSLAGGLALVALVLAVPRTDASPTGSTGPTPETRLPETPPAVDPLPTSQPQSADGSLKLTGRLSHPVVAAGTSGVFLTVDITGVEVPGKERAPVNLALVIDRSGSMAGEKLARAKEAARHLVNQLRPTDRLAIVHYGSDVQMLRSLEATEANKAQMLRFIDQITDDGGTNIGDGLQSGKAQLLTHLSGFKVNRMILISDGEPTEGITGPKALMQLARQIRTAGVTVSAIGVGDEFNEDLMQGLAEYGAGAYGYLQDASRLASIFQKDLQQAGTTVARNVELSFELPDGVSLAEVIGYRTSQAGRTVRVALPDFSAGQVERVVAKLNVRTAAVGERIDVAHLSLAYDDLLADKPVETKTMLAALVTDRVEEVALRRDKEATVIASRAVAARNLSRAADALAHGNREKAEALMEENEAVFGDAAAVAGAAAVAPDVAAMNDAATGLMEAHSEAEVRQEVKAAKARALKGFGRMGSTY